MGTDSGGLVRQPGPAGGWLLPDKACGGWYFRSWNFLPSGHMHSGPRRLRFGYSDPNSNLWGSFLRRGQGNRDIVSAT